MAEGRRRPPARGGPPKQRPTEQTAAEPEKIGDEAPVEEPEPERKDEEPSEEPPKEAAGGEPPASPTPRHGMAMQKWGWARRMRRIEVSQAITATRSDRQPMERRLRAAEVAVGLTIQPQMGFHQRMSRIEINES